MILGVKSHLKGPATLLKIDHACTNPCHKAKVGFVVGCDVDGFTAFLAKVGNLPGFGSDPIREAGLHRVSPKPESILACLPNIETVDRFPGSVPPVSESPIAGELFHFNTIIPTISLGVGLEGIFTLDPDRLPADRGKG
jgi:hypothetical protein